MKIIRLDDVQIFVHTADAGSFSEAARQLNIAPGQASASVQRLEKALDARLFTRSTRSMQLSEAGERYLPHARIMVGAREQGEQALAGGRETLSGPLRLHEMHLARVTDSAEFFSVGADSFGELTSRNLSGVYACFTVGADREIEFSDHFAQIHTNWHSGRHKGKFTLDQIFGVTPDVVRHVGHMYIECGERSLEFHSAYLFDASKLSDTGS